MRVCLCVSVAGGGGEREVVAAAGELFWSRVFLCLVVLSTAETKQIYKPDWACECDST